MTLLSMCQLAAQSCQITAPAAIVGNADETALTLLALAQDEGESLARRPQGGWVSMIKEYDFSTVAIGPLTGTIANTGAGGVAQISGLSSTTGISANTFYATGTGMKSNTTVSSVDSGTQVTLSQAASQTGVGVSVTFGQSDYALPADFQRIVDQTIWDRSRFWAMRGPQSPQQWQLYKSSVIGKAAIQRRWRIRTIAGNRVFSIDPAPTDNGSPLVLEYVSTGWCQSSGGTPQSRWAADTDTGVLDEYLMRLGIKWRLLERLGTSYAAAREEYERQADKAMAHDGGAAILSLTPNRSLTLIGPWNLPETGFGNVTG